MRAFTYQILLTVHYATEYIDKNSNIRRNKKLAFTVHDSSQVLRHLGLMPHVATKTFTTAGKLRKQ